MQQNNRWDRSGSGGGNRRWDNNRSSGNGWNDNSRVPQDDSPADWSKPLPKNEKIER